MPIIIMRKQVASFLAMFSIAAAATAEHHVNQHSEHATSIEVFDDRALEVIDPKAKITIEGTGYSWSEGPVWVEDHNFLLFTDVPQNVVYKYTEKEGVTEYLRPSGATGLHEGDSQEGANGLLINAAGELVMMHHGDRRVAKLDAPLDKPMPKYTTLAGTYDSKRFNSPNDGVFHSNGDLYFTDPPYGLKEQRNDPNKQIDFDGVFRLKKDGTVVLEDSTIKYPNGIVLSPDEKKAFVAASDKEAATWYVFDVDGEGSLKNKQTLYDATSLVGKPDEKGLPDGMVTHSSGHIFATGPGGVYLFSQTGEVLAKIRTGKATANCTLSADEKTLYMTAHDTLMKVSLK